MKKNRDLIISFLVYGLGLLALLLADLYVNQTFSEEKIAEWAFLKSTVFIVGTICLLGYEQVFIRDQTLITRSFKSFVVRSFVISGLFSGILFLIKDYSLKRIIEIFISILLFAALSYSAAANRANFNLWKSQIATNLWKVILLIGLLVFIGDVSFYFSVALFIAAIISYFLKGFTAKDENKTTTTIDEKTARKIGLAFLLGNITLIFAVHGEQFLINLYGNEFVSGYLFSYFTVFTPIALSINGFLGFYLAPKIKKEGVITLQNFKKMSLKIFFFSVFITMVSIATGMIYFVNVLENTFPNIDFVLLFLISLLCLIRGVYVSTSVVLGIYASPEQLKKVMLLFGVTTIIYIFLVFLVLKMTTGVLAVQLIMSVSVLNWLLRLIISNKFTYITLKNL